MPEIAEAVDTAIASDEHDKDCYFCNAKREEREEPNDCDDSPDDDSFVDGLVTEGIKFKNDASKLGSALGGTPTPKKVTFPKKEYPVSVAAHHLIPGNAALKKSSLFTSGKYLRTGGKAKGNIGYDVNSKPNGEWLPGNYAVRPWGPGGTAFAAQSKINPESYAFAAIRAWRAQFHDSHEDYSTFVKDVLNKIHDKLKEGEDIWCPKAKKKDKSSDEKEPLYVLVNRLHTVSARMKRMLLFPISNWRKNVWTSRFSLNYMIKRGKD